MSGMAEEPSRGALIINKDCHVKAPTRIPIIKLLNIGAYLPQVRLTTGGISHRAPRPRRSRRAIQPRQSFILPSEENIDSDPNFFD